MKLIKPNAEIIKEENPYKLIELAGRTCYKSEDKITENSAKEFVDRIIKLEHGAMLEHGTVYLKIPANIDEAGNFLDEVPTWTKCKLVEKKDGNWWAITTNYRVLVEHFAEEYVEYILENYLCEPTEYHERRMTAKFTCDRGVSHEIVRHRVMSFAQESQRYCNYSKDKFNNELTFVIPTQCNYDEGNYSLKYTTDKSIFINSLLRAEQDYFNLLGDGWKPQEARAVLPNATKTEIVVTGFESDWAHFFKLRCSGKAHPDMQHLAKKLYFEMYGKEYSEEE